MASNADIERARPNEELSHDLPAWARVLFASNLRSQGRRRPGNDAIRVSRSDIPPRTEQALEDDHRGHAAACQQAESAASRQASLSISCVSRRLCRVIRSANHWDDTVSSGFDATTKLYVVQTNTKVIERCLLMTTDPGDLVLDPTCGSGTTAYVAEQWGRRWITCDSSRVALALAKHRLMTAKFDYQQLRPLSAEDVARNPHGTWLTDPTGKVPGKAPLRARPCRTSRSRASPATPRSIPSSPNTSRSSRRSWRR